MARARRWPLATSARPIGDLSEPSRDAGAPSDEPDRTGTTNGSYGSQTGRFLSRESRSAVERLTRKTRSGRSNFENSVSGARYFCSGQQPMCAVGINVVGPTCRLSMRRRHIYVGRWLYVKWKTLGVGLSPNSNHSIVSAVFLGHQGFEIILINNSSASKETRFMPGIFPLQFVF